MVETVTAKSELAPSAASRMCNPSSRLTTMVCENLLAVGSPDAVPKK